LTSTLLRVMMPAVGAGFLRGYDAGGGRDDARVAEILPGHIELRLDLENHGLGLLGAGFLRGHLIGARLGRCQSGLGLLLALLGHIHSLRGRILGVAGAGERGLGGVGGGHSGVKLLLADHILFHQRLEALQIGLCLGVAGLGLSHLGVSGLELLLRQLDAGLGAGQIGVGRAQLAAGVDAGDWHIDVGGGCRSLRAGEGCLGILHGDLVIGGVQLGDHVARLDHLILIDIDLGDLSGDARTDLDQVSVDLGVVRVFTKCRTPPETHGNQRQDGNHDQNNGSAAGIRLRGLAAFFRIAFDGYRGIIRHVYFPPR
jgi:hypothetical protein